MKIGNDYIVERSPSIFVSRTGREDVNIFRRTNGYGAKKADGYYDIIVKFCSETGETLRAYAPLPPEITHPLLKQWGFINA